MTMTVRTLWWQIEEELWGGFVSLVSLCSDLGRKEKVKKVENSQSTRPTSSPLEFQRAVVMRYRF